MGRSSPKSTYASFLSDLGPFHTWFITVLSFLMFFCLSSFCNKSGLFMIYKIIFFSIPNLSLSCFTLIFFFFWHDIHITSISHVKGKNSLAFSAFTVVYNIQPYLVPQHFHHPRGSAFSTVQLLPVPPYPAPENPQSVLCLYKFTCSGCFVQMESYI